MRDYLSISLSWSLCLHQLRFQAIEEPFMSAMKETFGRQFNSYLKNMYSKTIKFILSTLEIGFTEDV